MNRVKFIIYILYFLVFCFLFFGFSPLCVKADNPYVNIDSCVLSLSGNELVVSGTLVGAKAITMCQQPCGFPTPGLCCQIRSAIDVSDTKREMDLIDFGIIPPEDLILIQTGGGGACWTGICDGPAYVWRFSTAMDLTDIDPGTHTAKISAFSNSLWAFDTCEFVKSSAPSATNLNAAASDWCSASPAYYLSWIYSDPDSDTESRFDLQIDDSGPSFPTPEIDRSYSGLSNPSPTTNNQAVLVITSLQADYLTYGKTYNWRVKVYDSNGLDSGWVNGLLFTTPNHRAPSVDFNWSPISPAVGESTNFFDVSTCYNVSGISVPCATRNWIFSDGTPPSSTLQNPASEFSPSGMKNISLQIIDSLGTQCTASENLFVNFNPKDWREIKPW